MNIKSTKKATSKTILGQRLLIADSDPAVLETLSAGLMAAGFKVLEASTGEQALKFCIDQPLDLILLDINLPFTESGSDRTDTIDSNSLSNLGIIKRIREFNLPIMFLSQRDEKEMIDISIANGAIGYLVKPININQIIPAVDNGLRRAAEIETLNSKEKNLTTALQNGRDTSIAIGILMAHSHHNAQDAEKILRQYSRNKRIKMSVVAEQIINQSEMLNNLIKEITIN